MPFTPVDNYSSESYVGLGLGLGLEDDAVEGFGDCLRPQDQDQDRDLDLEETLMKPTLRVESSLNKLDSNSEINSESLNKLDSNSEINSEIHSEIGYISMTEGGLDGLDEIAGGTRDLSNLVGF